MTDEHQRLHDAAAYFQFDKLADGTMYYEQVKAKYRNDADVIPLYAHPPTLRLPEPMTDAEIIHSALHAALIPKDPRDAERMKVFARSIEAETLRRVKECNAAPPSPVQQDAEALEVLKLALDALNCGDTGNDLEDSHRCGRCDENVDRNASVRQRIRAILTKRGSA